MDNFKKEGEKQISSSNISEAIGRYFDKGMGQYSTEDSSKIAVLKANGGLTSY